MSPRLLSPETLLPSGWSVDPVTGCCIRLSDGARFGRATSEAIAWSTEDLEARQPPVTGLEADLARVCDAVGCAVVNRGFTGSAGEDQATIDAIRTAGKAVADGDREWHWELPAAVDGKFNERLGCFLDAIGIERARLPAASNAGGEEWLLAGRMGAVAVRSRLLVRDEGDAHVLLQAFGCGDAGAAMQRARSWAITAVRDYLGVTAAHALGFVHRIPFHADDVACAKLARAIRGLVDECDIAADGGQAPRGP